MKLLLVIFWLFVLLPTLPVFLMILGFGKLCGFTDKGFIEFSKEWLTFRVIP
jgi:hypothetical protein